MYNRLSKTVSLATVAVILFLLKGSSASQDLTEVEDASGSDVVRATIARLDRTFGTNTTFWDVSQSTFMRTLAYVETSDGSIEPRNVQMQRGIWSVDIRNLNSARLSIGRSPVLNNTISEIESRLGFGSWNAIVDDDNLNKPFYSAIGARLILIASRLISSRSNDLDYSSLCDLDRFSTLDNAEALAQFWYTCYRLQAGEIDSDSLEHFVNRAEELQDLSEYGNY